MGQPVEKSELLIKTGTDFSLAAEIQPRFRLEMKRIPMRQGFRSGTQGVFQQAGALWEPMRDYAYSAPSGKG
jgi:hypothetical protein